MTEPSGNGSSNVKAEQLSIESMWEVIAEALAQIQEQLDSLGVQQVEIIEKLANLSLDNDGFETYED